MKMRIPFESDEALATNEKLFETIYFAALTASMEIAKEMGPYQSYEGSPISQGLFQFDLWGKKPKTDLDWEGLRAQIKTYGVRNSLLLAPMPTASTSQIMGNNEYIDDDILKEAENIYNNNGKNNADFQHTLGLLYYKNKNYKKAKETMIDAVMNLHKNDGYISSQNELLNNCINMHQFEQSDIENVLKLDGIYS